MAEQDKNSTRAAIRRLQPQVANQIAAGEVVERPASVVKELIENAMDAGATQIEAHLEDGGRKLLRIVDDGCGIAADEVLLAFERHATSKIATAADLSRVATYGFRGEALASIASVARITMTTRQHGEKLGTKVVGDGHGELTATPVSCAPGTDLTVADLFESVPARREFMRTAATELGHVIRLLDAIALARMDLGLKLFHNGRKVSDYAPSTNLMGRAATVFGADVAKHLQPVVGEGDYRVQGALSAPTLSRGTSAALTLIVNDRPVSDKTLVHAVRTAYGNLLAERRHPVGVLCLQCPPATVDVNVHPSKTQVRFLSKQAVHAAVVMAVSAMLEKSAWLTAHDVSLPVTRKGTRPHAPGLGQTERPRARTDLFASPLSAGAHNPTRSIAPARPQVKKDWAAYGNNSGPSAQRLPVPSSAGSAVTASRPSQGGSDQDLIITLVQADSTSFQSPLRARYVGQVANRWLLFDTGTTLALVDRATAAETGIIASGGTSSHRLMIPLHVGLGSPLVDALQPALKRMQRHGLEIAPVPRGGVLVRTAPQSLTHDRVDAMVRSLAGSLMAMGAEMSSSQMHAKIDATIARFAAPSVGEIITNQQARMIARSVDATALPVSDRDGAAAIVVISLSDLANRVGG